MGKNYVPAICILVIDVLTLLTPVNITMRNR